MPTGRCNRCGKPRRKGKIICDRCAAKAIEARRVAARKPCADCGKTKGEGRMRYCERCAKKHEARLCQRCGKPKEVTGRGRKLCDSCQPVRPLPGHFSPCSKCGSTAPKSVFGHQLCDDCVQVEKEVSAVRRRTRKMKDRKPCKRCGRAKRHGQGVRYCDACKADLATPRVCGRCKTHPVLERFAQICEPCRAESRKRIAANKAAWHTAHPEARQAARERHRKSKREASFEWRLKQDKAGRKLEPVETAVGRNFPTLPARPLALVIQRLVDREDRMLAVHDPCRRTSGVSMGAICKRLGIEQRAFTGWRSGERLTVEFDQVDTVLTRAGWLWWDVFSEETCRRPLFTVVHRELRSNGPKKPKGWQTVRRDFVGDWGAVPRLDGEGFEDGVDREALALVEMAFTGEGAVVPAPTPPVVLEPTVAADLLLVAA